LPNRASRRAPRPRSPDTWTSRNPPAPTSSTSNSQSIAATSRASTDSASATATPRSKNSVWESVIVVLAMITEATLSR
jgi:hypothetical protein